MLNGIIDVPSFFYEANHGSIVAASLRTGAAIRRNNSIADDFSPRNPNRIRAIRDSNI